MADGSFGGPSPLVRRRVTVQEVLEHLGSVTTVASGFGAQLDRAREGTDAVADHVRAQERVEARMLASAAVLRCVDALGATTNLFRVGEACREIRAFAVRAGLAEGAAVVGVMRAFEPWRTSYAGAGDRIVTGPDRGLVEVYAWARARLPTLPGVEPGEHPTLAHAFLRADKGVRRAKAFAAALVADAEVVTHAWVQKWNLGVCPSCARSTADGHDSACPRAPRPKATRAAS